MQTSFRLALMAIILALSWVATPQATPQATPLAASDANTLIQDFVSIPAGRFYMGTRNLDEAIADSPTHDAALVDDEVPARLVIFDKPFLLARTEVTQKLWFDVMQTRPGPDRHWQHPEWQQLPVVSVSWQDVQSFLERLNQRSTDYRYRLPTEAEWEYAARAGDQGLRPFSRLAMDEYAWYIHNSNDEIQPVARLEANPWGLYDIYGNVWEWVSDWYNPKRYAQVQDGMLSTQRTGPESGSKKVRRGGSYHCQPHLIRPAYRAADTPDTAYSVLGFRLVAEKK